MAASAQSIKEIKEAFDVYDTDGSGEITSAEILQVLKELGLHSESGDVDAMMNEFDRNKDGKVTFPEFAKVIGGRFYVERSHNEITQMFKAFDKDGNGSLSQNEILEGMKRFRGNFSKRQVLDLIRKVDKNKDNSISINEFVKLLELSSK